MAGSGALWSSLLSFSDFKVHSVLLFCFVFNFLSRSLP